MLNSGTKSHRFLGLPGGRPRVWIDLSSAVSKRSGLSMHSPGRKVLRWAVKILGWFAWLPVEKILRGPVKRFDELDGHEVIEKIVEGVSRSRTIEYLTFYMGNDSSKTKLTLLVGLSRGRESKSSELIVKLGRTAEAAAAIRNEYAALKRLESTSLSAQVPVAHGEVGGEGVWTWSVQSVLPKGKSPVRLQKEHYEFLDELKKVGLSHGDFAPWNCSVVGGKLHVWDWEDAGPWEDGKDEAWFKGQVKKLLGINA